MLTSELDITPKAGALRVFNIINIPGDPVWYDVATPEEGWRLINQMANAQLKIPWIISNAFGLCVYDEGEWNDWESPAGDDLDTWAELQGLT